MCSLNVLVKLNANPRSHDVYTGVKNRNNNTSILENKQTISTLLFG